MLSIVKFRALLGAENPFYTSSFTSNGGADYVIGGMCILLSILSLLFIPKVKGKMADYKKRQLEEYNKNRPGRKDATNYESTGLYLPMFERMKYSSPVILCVLFLLVGVTFFAGKPISTL